MEAFDSKVAELRDSKTDEEQFEIFVGAQLAYTVGIYILGHISWNVLNSEFLDVSPYTDETSKWLLFLGHYLTLAFSGPLILWSALAYYADI